MKGARSGRLVLAAAAVTTLFLGVATASTATPPRTAIAAPRGGVIGYGVDDVGPTALGAVTPDLVESELGSRLGSLAAHREAPEGARGPTAAMADRDRPSTLAVGLASPPGRTTTEIRCVGDRQTADPLAPPCVASFDGPNEGSTWRGVTATEVGVVLRVAGGGNEPDPSIALVRRTPTNRYVDLDAPLGSKPPIGARTMQALAEYFNRRFQTYGRRVHITLHYDNNAVINDVEQSRALAAEYDVRLRPFGLLFGHHSKGQGDLVHVVELANRGLVVFDVGSQGRSFSDQFPGRLWTLRPSIEHQARLISSYVCSKAVPYPVSMSGNVADLGRPRKLAVVRVENQDMHDVTEIGRLVKTSLQRCSAETVEELVLPAEHGLCPREAYASAFFRDEAREKEMVERVTALRARGVTTLVWPACSEPRVWRTTEELQWRPEWILGGDGVFDRATLPFFSTFGATLHRHAVVVTPRPFEPPVRESICARAVREIDASITDFHELHHGCRRYALLRQLFTGVQLAGSRLDPASLSAGFAQFPAVTSSDAEVPSCLYLAGEHSCVKDAQVQWWDASPQSDAPVLLGSAEVPAGGCWRSIDGGRRYLPDAWPAGNIDAQITWNERCSAAFSE